MAFLNQLAIRGVEDRVVKVGERDSSLRIRSTVGMPIRMSVGMSVSMTILESCKFFAPSLDRSMLLSETGVRVVKRCEIGYDR